MEIFYTFDFSFLFPLAVSFVVGFLWRYFFYKGGKNAKIVFSVEIAITITKGIFYIYLFGTAGIVGLAEDFCNDISESLGTP